MDAGAEYVSRNIDGWHSTPPKMTVLNGIKMGKTQGKSLALIGSSGQMIQLNAAGDNAPQLVDGQGHSSAIVALPSWSGNVRLPVLEFVLADFPETEGAAGKKIRQDLVSWVLSFWRIDFFLCKRIFLFSVRNDSLCKNISAGFTETLASWVHGEP